jgi:hypothetical protein
MLELHRRAERLRGGLLPERGNGSGAVDRKALPGSRHARHGTAGRRVGEFRRQGEYWTIALDGEVLHLRDTIGLRHLAQLVARPGREVHVLDLLTAASGNPTAPVSRAQASADGLRVAALRAAPEGPDGPARAAYRRRIQERRP